MWIPSEFNKTNEESCFVYVKPAGAYFDLIEFNTIKIKTSEMPFKQRRLITRGFVIKENICDSQSKFQPF